LRQLLHIGDDARQHRRIGVEQVARGRLRNDEEVPLGLREDVHHHEHLVVFEHLVRRNLAAQDLAEDVVWVVGAQEAAPMACWYWFPGYSAMVSSMTSTARPVPSSSSSFSRRSRAAIA